MAAHLSPFRGTLAADVAADPAKLLQVNPAQLVTAGVLFPRIVFVGCRCSQRIDNGEVPAEFPDDQHDLRGVPTYSYAGSIAPARVTPLLIVPAILLASTGQQNDGIVPLASATLKNHEGSLQVDHFGLVGWTPTDVTNSYRQIYATISSLSAR